MPAIEAALARAEAAEHPAERFVAAYAAAMQVAAQVLSQRQARLSGRRSVWWVLVRVAPELGEWAEFFNALQLKRQAIEAGAVGIVTAREADDLLRDAHSFARAARLAEARRRGRQAWAQRTDGALEAAHG